VNESIEKSKNQSKQEQKDASGESSSDTEIPNAEVTTQFVASAPFVSNP